MKKYLLLFFFFFILFCAGIDGVKADKFNVVYKCGGASASCSLSIIDGKIMDKTDYCDISGNWNGSIEDRKIRYVDDDISSSETSKCYKLTYNCVWNAEDGFFDLKDMKLTATSITHNYSADAIICPSRPWIDPCAGYTADNFESKCPNHAEGVTYEIFRSKCDLSPTAAKEYCNGTRKYNPDGSTDDSIDDIRGWAQDPNVYKDDTEYSTETTCSSLLGKELSKYLKDGFTLLCIVGVILLVFMMASDFIKVIASGEADKMAEVFRNSFKRIASTIILLLLPILVNFVINFINDNVTVHTDKDGKSEIKIGSVSECLGDDN